MGPSLDLVILRAAGYVDVLRSAGFGGLMQVLVNIVAGYLAWLAVAILAARGEPLLAVLPSLAAIGLHFAVMPAPVRGNELRLIALAIPVGFVVETILLKTGVTRYAEGASIGGLPPLFMIGLWMAFATFLNVSLAWLKARRGLVVLFGALASGPSYYAGAKIGALTLAEPTLLSLAAIGACWMVAFPLLMAAARRLDR